MTRLQVQDRRRMHAFTTSDLGPRHGWGHAEYPRDIRLEGGPRWDFGASAVYVVAWGALVTVALAVVALGAGVGWLVWRAFS